MKHYITIEQLHELSKEGKEKLSLWWKPNMGDLVYSDDTKGIESIMCCEDEIDKGLDLPLLSISQMIEFLDDRTEKPYGEFKHWLNTIATYTNNDDGVHPNYKGELCDALWEAVKEVLNEK